MSAPLLSVRISDDYPNRPSVLAGITLDLHEGEACGLAGESGSGKSTIALAILRLLEWRGGRVRGHIWFDGQDLMQLKERVVRRLRGKDIALVAQSPASALNPALRLETQIREAWRAHSSIPWAAALPCIQAELARMGLPAERDFLSRFPSQISVGQAQRVVIAMAVLHRPKLILADEPTSALDAGSRREILKLLRDLKQEHRAALLYISHDAASIEELCDRVYVLEAGRLAPAASGRRLVVAEDLCL